MSNPPTMATTGTSSRSRTELTHQACAELRRSRIMSSFWVAAGRGPLTVTATCVELTLMRRDRAPSAQMVSVLRALAADASRWRYGYDLGTEVHLKSGSLYPILVRLADRGLLEASWEPGVDSRPPRHLYRLTGAGREYLAGLPAARAARGAPRPRLRASEAS